MKKYWFELTVIALFVLSVGFYIGVIVKNEVMEAYNTGYSEAYDKGYLDGENHAIIDFMEDYFEVLIENARLEERLKNQPSNEKYIKQIVDDFELLLELQQHYYQENITTHSFGDWIQINYPELYERIRSYF